MAVLLEYLDLLQPKNHLESTLLPLSLFSACYTYDNAHLHGHVYVYVYCMVKDGLPARIVKDGLPARACMPCHVSKQN